MKTVLIGLAVAFILATVLPLVRSDEWWVRVFDFPRMQIAVAGLVITAVYVYFWDTTRLVEDIVLGVLVLCVGYQTVKMFPYTVLAPKQVESVVDRGSAADTSAARISILVSNVLMDNRAAQQYLDLISEYDPDVILSVETDDWWDDQLSILDADYPYSVKEPQSNTYGMILHSRIELVDPVVRRIVDESVPSIHARVHLAGGATVMLHCLHPRPPHPREDTDTEARDAELMIVGREVKERSEPAIVLGDMNDVAWSRTTSLFQKVSGLLDPRVGRGMYNSFNAQNVLLRWPLDHIFHSEHFKLIDLQRLPAWGSDHFPIFVHLEYSASAEHEHDTPEADQEDQEAASEIIEKGD